MENIFLTTVHQISKLHPTQFCVGQLEINEKVKKYSQMSHNELMGLMKDKSVPLVLGPNKISYMIDRHHNVSAFLQVGMNEVYAHYIADLSFLSQDKFEQVMKICNWTWLYDENHQEKHFNELPNSITILVNDPYRSLMYLLRESKVLNKDESVPFIEFSWAQIIRKHIKLTNHDELLIHQAFYDVLNLMDKGKIVIKDMDLKKVKELLNERK